MAAATDITPAPFGALFSPAAIVARADAFAAEHARRRTAAPPVADHRSAEELLTEIRRVIERQYDAAR